MKKITVFIYGLFLSLAAFSQDTTWVQTYTFDTIVTRRATFEFPASLDSKRFEKVLMYYKLKCSPLTTWDQYDCAEWDALTNARIFEHTGTMDSLRTDGSKFRVNTQSPPSLTYKNNVFFDKKWKTVNQRTPLTLTAHGVSGTPAPAATLMNMGANGGTMQWIITGSELAASGAVTGDIQGLQLSFPQLITKLEGVKIRLKNTALTTLTTWETIGFTTVFDNTIQNVPAGNQNYYFSAPFVWDGASNIIVELSVADANPATGDLKINTREANAGSMNMYANMNGTFKASETNYAEVNMSQVDIGGDFTVAFWAKGSNLFGSSKTVLEAIDSVGNRIVNIHFPWADNNVYFDAGNQNGFDRLTKTVTAMDVDLWHHWAFVKKTSTGEMFIYKDGVLFQSATNMNRSVGKITRWVLGADRNQNYKFKGELDEFSIWSDALSASAISGWMNKKITAVHPYYSALELYYDFDDIKTIADKSVNNRHAMPSDFTMVNTAPVPVAGYVSSNVIPVTHVLQGTMNQSSTATILTTVFPSPEVLFEYEAADNSFNITSNSVVYREGTIDTLDANGTLINNGPSGSDETILNDTLTYYGEPFDVINDIEIGRYITPYGIQFSLGPQGFTWIYDVTDYQKYLHGMVDLAAHNTMELIDLKFAFVEGIPPRDVHNIEPIWGNWRSYNYGQLAADQVLSAKTISLSDTSDMFKIKTRFTGHGHYGMTNCCEWTPNDHKIMINGVERFNWNIWKETECGENPNIGQGGTWPYAREGWCPGDAVKEYDHEITPFVTPGTDVSIDYDITDVPANDPDRAGGDYIGVLDLVSYSAPNFQHDAAIVDVLNPNAYELYSKFNPSCANPRIILQNTGALPLTKCKIRLWASYGHWQEFDWNGNLAFLQKEVVEIPITNTWFWYGIDASNPVFHAQVYAVEGSPDLDEYANNNEFKTRYKLAESTDGPFFVHFKTNNKAAENKWKLVDADGTTIFERTTLTNSTEYKDTFDLAPGCYSIILEDSDDDGIGFWYSSETEGETSGYFRIRKIGSGYIETFPNDFGKYHRWNFTVGFTLGLEESAKEDTELMIFPNPVTDNLRVEYNGGLGTDVNATITDANGRILKSQPAEQTGGFAGANIETGDLSKGMYFISLKGSNGLKTAQFVKQ